MESSRPDLEGIQNALECAEVAACYVACIAIIAAGTIPGVQVRYVSEMAKRIGASNKPHGTSMGDWVAILREVCESKAMRAADESFPFGDLAGIDEETDQVLQRLFDARNDCSHGRGPKGRQVESCFEEYRANVESFLEGVEFVTEYPLCYIEKAMRDTILGQTKYQFRELMGDHPLVPLSEGRTEATQVEEGSLYVVDRAGDMHLARPLLNLIECPECGRQSVFCLDRYSKMENACVLKSMEHGHTAMADESAVVGLRRIGLLPEL